MWAWVVGEFDLADDDLFVLGVANGEGEIRVVAKDIRMVDFPIYDD